jgi:ABC-2 type transport system ATP-binding protein
MEEADRLCDRLAIIDHGTIIAEGSPAALKAALGGDVVVLSLKDAGQAEQAAARLKELPFVRSITTSEAGLNVIVASGGAAIPDMLRLLDAGGMAVATLSMTSPTLDDVFLKHTGHSIRQEELKTDWRAARGWGMPRRGGGR